MRNQEEKIELQKKYMKEKWFAAKLYVHVFLSNIQHFLPLFNYMMI